jgi:hypothetical protein
VNARTNIVDDLHSLWIRAAGLLSLLNWQSHKHELPEVLKRITFVEQAEVMKFLPETFYAMFEILHRNARDEKLRSLVYDALIFVLGMFAEDRALLFVNFRPVLDKMIQAYEQMVPFRPSSLRSALC